MIPDKTSGVLEQSYILTPVLGLSVYDDLKSGSSGATDNRALHFQTITQTHKQTSTTTDSYRSDV